MAGFWETLSDWLTRPSSASALGARALLRDQDFGRAVMSGLGGRQKLSYRNVLEEDLGMEKGGWGSAAAGLAGDVLLDPTFYIPLGGIPRAAKAIGRAIPGASRLAAATKATPLVQGLGDAFVPFFDLPAEYVAKRRLLNAGIGFSKHEAAQEALRFGKPFSESARKAATFASEDPSLITPEIRALVENVAGRNAGIAEREVAAGLLDNVRPDYITHMYNSPLGVPVYKGRAVRELSANNRFAQARTWNTLKEAIAAGADPELDIAKVYAARKYASEKALRTKAFLDDLIQDPALARNIKSDVAIPADWRRLTIPAPYATSKALTETAFAPKVARDIDRLINPESDNFLKHLDPLLSGWKTAATVMRPGFHVRNELSNAFNAFLGGTYNPTRRLQAGKFLLEAAGDRMATARMPSVGKYSGEAIKKAAQEYGVLGFEYGMQGNVGDVVADQLARGLGKRSYNPLKAWTKAGRDIGYHVENGGRLAMYLDQLAKGKTLEEAAPIVNKWMIDYAERTPFERTVMSRAVPFWQWTSRNIPLQLQSLVNQPWKTALVPKAYEAVSAASGGQPPLDMLPEWLREGGVMRAPWKATGGLPTFWSPSLPTQDLARLPANLSAEEMIRSGREVAGMLNPIAKAPIELLWNKDVFQNRPVYNEQNPSLPVSAPSWIKALASYGVDVPGTTTVRRPQRGPDVQMHPFAAYLLKQVPIAETIGKAATQRPADSDIRLGKAQVLSPAIMDLITGVRLNAFTPHQMQQTKREDQLKKVRKARAFLKLQRMEITPFEYQQMMER